MKNRHFCQSVRCGRPAKVGIFCEVHFGMVPPDLREAVAEFDKLDLLFLPLDAARVARLEAAASAVEAIAEAERHPVGNSFRRRLALWRDTTTKSGGTRR